MRYGSLVAFWAFALLATISMAVAADRKDAKE